MNNKRTVVLFGSSLSIATIGILLIGRDDLDVIQIDADLPDAIQVIQNAYPNIILFDQATVPPDTVLSLLGVQPHALLIGINLVNGTMLFLCGQHTRAQTTQDLFDAIQVDAKPFIQENHL